MMERITFVPYPADLPILEQLTHNEPGITVAVLVREIVGNYCADRRTTKRLAMEAHHYTARSGDDDMVTD